MNACALTISNLAWPDEALDDAIDLIALCGCTGVEVAPTKIAPWDEIDAPMMRRYRDRLADRGLRPSSLQAIFFGKPEAQLLGSAEAFAAMSAHVARIGAIAEQLGAGVAVFGAPKNRNRGTMEASAATLCAAERLGALGAIVAPHGLVLGIEPVPAAYGSDFANNWRDALDLVRTVDHPAVRLHLDTGCVALAGDDIGDAIVAAAGWLAHFHAAQPELGGFDDPLPGHAVAGRALDEAGYAKWVSIEMLQQPDWRQAVIRATDVVRAHYPLAFSSTGA